LHEQAVLRGNFTTDKIRQSAIGKRHMRPTLEDDDPAVLAQPSRPRCRAGPACDATDDEYAFVAYVFHVVYRVTA
jgi:hypothetical protein